MPDQSTSTAISASASAPSSSAPAPASTAHHFPPLSRAPPLPLTGDAVRAFILDYLTHSTYVDTAIAFVSDHQAHAGPSSASASFAPPRAPATAAAGPSSASNASGPGASNARGARNAAQSGNVEDEDEDEDDEMREQDGEDARMHAGSDGSNERIPLELDGQPLLEDGKERYPDFDSPLLSREEIRLIRKRRDIVTLVENGSIQAAIDSLNRHFPSVLAQPPVPSTAASGKSAVHAPSNGARAYPHSSPSGPSYWSASGASRAAASRLSHRPSNMSLAQSATLSAGMHQAKGPASVSSVEFPTQPMLLSISLQIQLFIEILRQSSASTGPPPIAGAGAGGGGISRPSTPYASAAASPSNGHGPGLDESVASLASHASGGSAMSGVSGGSSASASAAGSTSSGSVGTSALSIALAQVQSLHAQASALPDPAARRAMLDELVAVSALLPYKNPRDSPSAYYLDTSRRTALAAAVNGAILLSLGKGSTLSKLERISRQNSLIWQTLYDLKATYPPETSGPNKGKPPRPIHAFDMRGFMDTPVLPES